MRLLWLVLLVACSKPPPPKAATTEQPVDKVADIAGKWAANDDMDWGYSMTIAAPATIDVWIDRGKLGRCEQIGSIKPAGGRVFRVVYKRGECNPEAVGVPIDMTIASFTGSALTIVVGTSTRTYARAAAND